MALNSGFFLCKSHATALLGLVIIGSISVDYAFGFQPLLRNVQVPITNRGNSNSNCGYKISTGLQTTHLTQSNLLKRATDNDSPTLDSDGGSGRDGNGLNGGRGWFFGRWGGNGNGDQGGFRDGRWGIVAAAWADGAVPRIFNSTVIEADTGIKFPSTIFQNKGDKTGLQLLGAGSKAHRPWQFLWTRRVSEYAVGVYADAAAAVAGIPADKPNTAAAAQEALLAADFPRTIRVVLGRETDTWHFTADINDRIEAKMAKRSFEELAWLELWRNWMVDQGGFKQRLPKGIEIRFTQLPMDPVQRVMFVTEIRRRDRVLATKELDSPALGWAIFEAFLGDSPLAPAAKADALDGFQALRRAAAAKKPSK